MSLADEMRKLQELHQSGGLSDSEFAAAKAAVLAGGAEAAGDALREELKEIRRQTELARLDQEWSLERERYMIAGQYGYRSRRGMALAGGATVVAFGLLWTIMATAMVGNFGGPFLMFPLFGVLFIAFGAGLSIYTYTRAAAYDQAHAAYQRRRAAALRDPSGGAENALPDDQPSEPPTCSSCGRTMPAGAARCRACGSPRRP